MRARTAVRIKRHSVNRFLLLLGGDLEGEGRGGVELGAEGEEGGAGGVGGVDVLHHFFSLPLLVAGNTVCEMIRAM